VTTSRRCTLSLSTLPFHPTLAANLVLFTSDPPLDCIHTCTSRRTSPSFRLSLAPRTVFSSAGCPIPVSPFDRLADHRPPASQRELASTEDSPLTTNTLAPAPDPWHSCRSLHNRCHTCHCTKTPAAPAGWDRTCTRCRPRGSPAAVVSLATWPAALVPSPDPEGERPAGTSRLLPRTTPPGGRGLIVSSCAFLFDFTCSSFFPLVLFYFIS